MKIRMEIKGGGLVKESDIPPFNTPPEVLLWGNRVFTLASPAGAEEPFLYIEAFAYFLVDWVGEL